MYAENNGVKIWYEVHGQGELTLIMVPGFQLSYSEMFKKAYVPYLSRHMKVVTLDLRGNGKSDRTNDGYDLATYVEDIHAVVKTANLKNFVISGISLGVKIAIKYSQDHRSEVSKLVLLSGHSGKLKSEAFPKGRPREFLEAVAKNWRKDPQMMLNAFVELACSEKSSLRAKELLLRWARETTPQIWSKCYEAAVFSDVDDLLQKIELPVLVVHGKHDKLISPDEAKYLHESISTSKLILVDDSGHGFLHTWPQVARHILEFVKPGVERTLAQQYDKGFKILWISSPIGLGHVKRDLAVVTEMRKKLPQLKIDWLATDPVRSFLEKMGENIHPLSDALWDENGHMESYSTAYSLNPTEAYWEMDDLLANNFMVFVDATRQSTYDLVVGDEAWEVFKFLHYNPSMKTAPFVFITDFIGATNVSEDEIKKAHVQDINGSWVEMHEIQPDSSDLSIFLGDIEDIPDIELGEGLPKRRAWAKEHFKFPGYVFSFNPAYYSDRAALRRELSFLPEEKILLIAVGGTSVGRPLIDKCLEIQGDLKVKVPEIRTVVLCGPRIDPKSFGEFENVDFLPFIDDPIKLFAACDLAVIQGGLSTAMELTTLNRPFLYFPLKEHFEQQHMVDLRLKRLNAGIRMDFDGTGPRQLLEAITSNISKPVNYKTISQDGAKVVAEMILGSLSEKRIM